MSILYFLENVISVYFQGGTGLIIGHPLDTVKVRLQTIGGYNGIIDCFTKTMKNESVNFLKSAYFSAIVIILAIRTLQRHDATLPYYWGPALFTFHRLWNRAENPSSRRIQRPSQKGPTYERGKLRKNIENLP